VVQKGPFIHGSSVTVQSLDEHLAPTGQTFEVVTADDLGNFKVPVNVTSQYVEIVATGYYFDELTNGLSAAPLTLRAVADLTSGGTVDVNLLTSISERLIRNLVLEGIPFAQATAEAESRVLVACGFGSTNGFAFSQVDFTGSGTSSAALLAASLIVEQYARSLGGSEVASLTQLLYEIGAAAGDAGGNGTLLRLNASLCPTAHSIDVAAVRANLTAYYASVGAPVAIPDFERFVASAARCEDGGADADASMRSETSVGAEYEDAAEETLDTGSIPSPDAGTDDATIGTVDGGSDASLTDAPFVDAGSSGPPGDGSLACPTTLLNRAVGGHAAPAGMTWWGAGYTLIIANGGQMSAETTDATGAFLAGPSAIPSPTNQVYWPRVAFSGREYGITYRDGSTMSFMRTDAAFVPVAGSNLPVGNANHFFGNAFGTEAVAWSNQTWGVAWAQTTDTLNDATLYFQRFDTTGAPVAPAQVLGANGLSGVGVPMIATSEGWSILGSGSPAVLYEISVQGNVRTVSLPFNALTGSLASNGVEYGVAADQPPVGSSAAMFARVQVGGGVVAGSVATLGTPSANEPNVIWTGNDFLVTWSDLALQVSDTGYIYGPLRMARVSPSSTAGSFSGTPFTSRSDAGFHVVVAGACGWGALYMTYDDQSSLFLEVRP
jgi:hypothetical protein